MSGLTPAVRVTIDTRIHNPVLCSVGLKPGQIRSVVLGRVNNLQPYSQPPRLYVVLPWSRELEAVSEHVRDSLLNGTCDGQGGGTGLIHTVQCHTRQVIILTVTQGSLR